MRHGSSIWLAAAVCLSCLLVGSAIQAAELQGTVVEVVGAQVKIRVTGELMPRAGDKVQIGSTVPDVGFVAVEGTWKVSSVEGEFARAEPDGPAKGKPAPAMAAVIASPSPTRRGEKAVPADPVPGDPVHAGAPPKSEGKSGPPEDDTKRSTDPVPPSDQVSEATRRAAENGDAEAQFILGYEFYKEAQFMQKCRNYDARDRLDALAVNWLTKAAGQGHMKARNQLAVCMRDGRGVPAEPVAAAAFFRQSADQGYAEAQHNLGMLYENGLGVTKDLDAAAGWYRKAAAQGHELARKRLVGLSDSVRPGAPPKAAIPDGLQLRFNFVTGKIPDDPQAEQAGYGVFFGVRLWDADAGAWGESSVEVPVGSVIGGKQKFNVKGTTKVRELNTGLTLVAVRPAIKFETEKVKEFVTELKTDENGEKIHVPVVDETGQPKWVERRVPRRTPTQVAILKAGETGKTVRLIKGLGFGTELPEDVKILMEGDEALAPSQPAGPSGRKKQ